MRWSFCDASTGLFSSIRYSGPSVEENTPAGMIAIEGDFDPLSQRVELTTLQVVDWQPPKPDDDHEWQPSIRRWVLTRGASERAARRAVALARIAALETAQARPVRELQIDPLNTRARERLLEIEAEIAALRADLT